MSSERNEAQENGHPSRLAWYAAGTLDAESAREVEGHLATCSRCRKELEVWSEIHDALEDPDPGPHVASMKLCEYASDAQSLTHETRAGIEAHLAECAECRSDLGELRGLEARSTQRNPWKVAFTFAAAACVLLALLAARGLLATRATSGPVESGERILLESAYRGATRNPSESERAAEIHGPGPWSLTLVLPETAAPGDYEFRVEGGSEAISLSAAGRVRVDADRIAALWLRGPLRPGRYAIRLRSMARHDVEFTFELGAAP